MKKLREIIEKLEKESNEEKQEIILQEIGQLLLTEYVIQIGDITVYPLWVEAYYYNEKNFPDPFVHRADEQMEYNILYFHHKTDDQRNGVDICLSNGKYYLSFLLKYSLVNGNVKRQSELSPLIRKEYEAMGGKSVLIPNRRPTDKISCTTRIGLSESKETDINKKNLKEKFKKYKLSVVRDFDKTFTADFKLPQKENLVKEYLLKQTEMSKTEKADFCINALGYCLKEYKG